MTEPLEESYFNWLCAKVKQNPAPDYLGLFRLLHSVEFQWTIVGDHGREADGRQLREYFCTSAYVKKDREWLSEPASIFEVLIAFADRANFQTDRPLKQWFWEFITNLNLERFRRVSSRDESRIHDILYAFIWREYDDRGNGGLFPLRTAHEDQRRVELWYQFFNYLDDQGLM